MLKQIKCKGDANEATARTKLILTELQHQTRLMGLISETQETREVQHSAKEQVKVDK